MGGGDYSDHDDGPENESRDSVLEIVRDLGDDVGPGIDPDRRDHARTRRSPLGVKKSGVTLGDVIGFIVFVVIVVAVAELLG